VVERGGRWERNRESGAEILVGKSVYRGKIHYKMCESQGYSVEKPRPGNGVIRAIKMTFSDLSVRVEKVRGQKCGQKDKWTNCGQNVQNCGQNVQYCGQNGGQSADKRRTKCGQKDLSF
jgi:hypothetical protein